MITFHALVIGMTLQPLPNKLQYWQAGSCGTVIYPNFGRFMSRNRFQTIKRNFHLRCNDNRENFPKNSGTYRLWQTSQFSNILKTNFKKYYHPNKEVTVDERTVPIRNRMCPVRIYNPSKPYKFGIEIFTICDSVTFYCLDFIVYDKVPQVGLHTNVVVELCKGLPFGEKFDIILDRGFTSPVLLEKLRLMGHRATGTVMPNRKFLPKKKEGFELPDNAVQGDFIAFSCTDMEMTAIQWQDKKPVYFLSTSRGEFLCYFIYPLIC